MLLDFSKAGGEGKVTGSHQESLALLGTFTYIISLNPKNIPVDGKE